MPGLMSEPIRVHFGNILSTAHASSHRPDPCVEPLEKSGNLFLFPAPTTFATFYIITQIAFENAEQSLMGGSGAITRHQK